MTVGICGIAAARFSSARRFAFRPDHVRSVEGGCGLAGPASHRKLFLGAKARLYAAFGIKELSVINAVKLETHIHREPRGGRYHYKRKFKPNNRLVPKLAPVFAVTLSELELI